MSNSTSSVVAFALNPAFLEEIKDSNQNLWRQWAALREACLGAHPPQAAIDGIELDETDHRHAASPRSSQRDSSPSSESQNPASARSAHHKAHSHKAHGERGHRLDGQAHRDPTVAAEHHAQLGLLVCLLNELRDSLALQFSLEEAYGYVELPASRAMHNVSRASQRKTVGGTGPLHPQATESLSSPRIAQGHDSDSATNSLPIERLRSQHCGLYLQLNELTERAEDLQYRGCQLAALERLIAEIQRFDLELQDHERTERNLIAIARRSSRLIDPSMP